MIPWRVLRHLPAPETLTVEVTSDIHFRYVAAHGDPVGRQLFWMGFSRSPEAAVLRSFAYYARRTEVVLDVGANVGLLTLLALAVNPTARVVAFEPVAETAARLRNNLALNRWESRCSVIEAAVADQQGVISLHVPDGTWPASASLHPDGFRAQHGTPRPVSVTRLDDCTESVGAVGLLKIDVEGFEPAVLRGARKVLEHRPAIILECHADGPAGALDEILSAMEYRCYRLVSSGPRPSAAIADETGRDYRNFLCLPRERAGLPRILERRGRSYPGSTR